MSIKWDGEGLPPVGCEFEYASKCDGFSSWHKRECTAVGKAGILSIGGNEIELYHNNVNNRFRRIITESERRKYAAIKGMKDVIRGTDQCLAELYAIYLAIEEGKIPGVKLEDV